MMNIAKTKIAAYLTAIFLIGCVAGGFAAAAFFNKRPSHPGLSNLSEKKMAWMITALSLTEEQVIRIEPIVAEVADEIRTIRRDSTAEFARLYGELEERVEKELTPEQREIFRKIQDDRRQRAERMLRQHRKDSDSKGGGHWRGARDGPPPDAPPPLDPPPPPEPPTPSPEGG